MIAVAIEEKGYKRLIHPSPCYHNVGEAWCPVLGVERAEIGLSVCV